MPVFFIITGLTVLFCGCDLSPSSIINIEKEEEYDRWYIREHNDYSDEEWKECLDVLDELKGFGITMPERFSTLKDAEHIVEQRNNLDKKYDFENEPVTVAMYPVFDYGSRPLSARQNGLSKIINHTIQTDQTDQHVIYFQIGNDEEFIKALTLLKTNLRVADKFVLILAGHGNIEWLRWDDGGNFYKFEATDYEDKKLTGLLHDLPINLAIFHSCAAGEGRDRKKNQANRLAEHIPVGRTVLAPESTVISIICKFDPDNNKIIDVRYSLSASDTFETAAAPYRVNGKYK